MKSAVQYASCRLLLIVKSLQPVAYAARIILTLHFSCFFFFHKNDLLSFIGMDGKEYNVLLYFILFFLIFIFKKFFTVCSMPEIKTD